MRVYNLKKVFIFDHLIDSKTNELISFTFKDKIEYDEFLLMKKINGKCARKSAFEARNLLN